MDHKRVISVLLPLASILIMVGFIIFVKPPTTGLVTLNPINGQEQTIDADITFSIYEDELIPENAQIIVMLDNKGASMTIKEFIEKSKGEFHYTYGKLKRIGYEGYGYMGNYTYTLTLKDFNLGNSLKAGQHELTTRLVYEDKTLFEKVESFVIP